MNDNSPNRGLQSLLQSLLQSPLQSPLQAPTPFWRRSPRVGIPRRGFTATVRQYGLTVLMGLAGFGGLGSLGGCASLQPITHSGAAPQLDAALGQTVRAARAAQTLNPQAGQDPLLPQEVGARAAMGRMTAGGGWGGRGAERAGSSMEPLAGAGGGTGGGAGH